MIMVVVKTDFVDGITTSDILSLIISIKQIFLESATLVFDTQFIKVIFIIRQY